MKKTILTFGFISGAVLSLLTLATIPFADKIAASGGEYLGYTIMVLSFLLVFFGIRSYRDVKGEGQITFTRGFLIGIAITVISSVCYVVTWELLYFNSSSIHLFMEKYSQHMVDKVKASGASAASMQEQLQRIQRFKELYENPFFNSLFTFIEPFPVGLIITLISAAILRRKRKSVGAALPA